jgi:hypothetical protein
MTIYSNPQQLPQPIVVARLHTLDPIATCRTIITPVYDIFADPIVLIETQYYAEIDAAVSDEVINALLATPVSAEETELLTAYIAAPSAFRALPNWSTWTPAQAEEYISTSILSGSTQVQIDAWIDSTVTNLAGARTAFKQLAGSLIATRIILINVAKAILFLRDLLVTLRN